MSGEEGKVRRWREMEMERDGDGERRRWREKETEREGGGYLLDE